MARRVAIVVLSVLLALTSVLGSSFSPSRPPWEDKTRFARWLLHYSSWGVVSTESLKMDGRAYGSVLSYSDGVGMDNSTGTPYLYITQWDESGQDLAANPNATLAVTEEAISSTTGDKTCSEFDPEDPNCAKLTIVGQCVRVTGGNAIEQAKEILFSRHPQMKLWPANHGFQPFKFEMTDVVLLDFYGGATHIDPKTFLAASPWKPSTQSTTHQ